MKHRLLHILMILLAGSLYAQAQEVVADTDSLLVVDSIPFQQADSTGLSTITDTFDPTLVTDSLDLSLITDSVEVLTVDSLLPEPKKSPLEAPVAYEATDSIVMTAGNWAYLYGDANVKYQQIELQSEFIQMNMDSTIVYAQFGIDSIGDEFGFPLFIDGGEQYESRTMRYNFNTKRGYITDVITQQGEGYVTSNRTKKMENDILNMIDGRYTTCDHHDHPHFYIHMTKAKVRPKKNIVTGPVYLVFEGVPLPIGLPFAFFPFSDKYSSGVIFPSFGDESNRGFFIREGGYYFAINDYVDLAVTGDIYTKGSWALGARSTYRKRYKYSGNFETKYVVTKNGDKDLPDYSVAKDFMLRWTHTQDAKANPYRSFSASVNFATSSYNRNELNEQFNSNGLSNTKGSTVNVTQRFPNNPFTLSATMSINQTSRDSTISVTLPDFTATMSRQFPFKRKQRLGKEQWYEKISVSYTGVFRNSITTKEDKLFKSNLVKDWQNMAQHTIPVSASFTVFDYLNITPSFNYKERWYTNQVEQVYDLESDRLIKGDTTYGFYRLYDYTTSVSFSTTLYGYYTPLPFLGDFVKTIRHRIEPGISLNYSPDFGAPRFGYYKDYSYINSSGEEVFVNYSPFSHHSGGIPGRGKSGSISFSLDNNVEMKIRSDKDSTGVKKISVIDKLSFAISHNLVADSFKWSDLNVGLRLKLSKSYTVNLNMVFDTYTYKYNEDRNTLTRVNVLRWNAGKGIGRLRSTGTSFSYTFNNDTFRKLFGGGGGSGDDSASSGFPDAENPTDADFFDFQNPDGDNMMETDGQPEGGGRIRRQGKKEEGDRDADGYMINTFPWSLSFNYSMSLGYDTQRIDVAKEEYKYKLTHALSFNGSLQPTKNWRLNFNATYDFDNKKISYLTCNITRNMHCFQMSASVIPVGNYKSYFFTVGVTSALLKDLKVDKRSNYRDGQSWY